MQPGSLANNTNVLFILFFALGVLYREAVAAYSPGLLQPWGSKQMVTNPERVASTRHNRVAVDVMIRFQTQGSRRGNPGLLDATASR